MQAGRRRGDGAVVAGVDGLVALGVLGLHVALAGDVGRQRRIAQRRDRLVEVGAVQAEGELDLARLADLGDGGVERAQQADASVVAEADAVADAEPLGGPREGAPAAFVDALVQVEGDLRAVVAPPPLALQRRADHARVVEHERIAGAEQIGQVADEAIVELPGGACRCSPPPSPSPQGGGDLA